MNPLLSKAELPKFAEIRPEHVAEAVDQMVAEVERGVAAIEADTRPASWDSVIEALNDIEDLDSMIWGPVRHLNSVMNSPALREAYRAAQPKIVAMWLKVEQSEGLYRKYLALRDGAAWKELDSGRQRAIEKRILSAELSGISLTGEKRERYNEIAKRLSELSTAFANNVIDATKAFTLTLKEKDEVKGLTQSVLEQLAQSYASHNPPAKADPGNGPWTVTLDMPSYTAFMQFAENRALREKVYRAYMTRASSGPADNLPGMNETLRLRAEEASLLGYKNFAELSLATKMAKSVDEVNALMEELRAAAMDPAKADLAEAQALAAASGHEGPLAHWDVAYWAKRLEEKKFQYTDEQLRPYFPLERVLDGLFGLTGRLFGVSVKPADGDAQVWHPDVRFFKIFDGKGGHIASFYLDPYTRPETKRGGAWMNGPVQRRFSGGVKRLPVASLTCNFTPPVGEKPSLLSFGEVQTLFHEFGHGLQHMLTTVDYSDIAGISNVEWDAVELASQFMENWCYHRETLLGMAKHYKTGETLPEDLFKKMQEAKVYRAGSQILRLVCMSMVDMALHTAKDPDIFAIDREISERASVMPRLPEDRFLCALTHIFAGGYAAGLYSYKWAEVLSADAFEAFEESGLENPAAVAATGARYAGTILALGGSEHPSEVFKKFRGRAPSIKAMLRHNALVKA